MKFGEIVAPSIKELFIQKIEGMILSSALKPGERLPTERELADEMNISKTIVHEGIRELSRLGFLDVVSRKGVTVADYAQNGNLDTLMAIMKYNGGYLNPQTAKSLLDVRAFLECPALEALAAHHTKEDIAKLEQLLAETYKAKVDGIHALSQAMFLFHRTIIFLSGNTITPLILNAFLVAGLSFWEDYILTVGEDASLERLEIFLDYIRNGKGKELADLQREWLEAYKCQKYMAD